ncbi:Zinc finger CCCH domain-containing protein 24 [Platanthera guangdongensis]|uniref:Zinc finger CCCH domain-containing protein 24 n=1 Tax=Platanthera guangdongensis TaxID=2320717 RepID=A0ABR2MCK1_9ASPA
MGLLLRTPLMVAAAFGSIEVLRLILSLTAFTDINLRCGADSSTALHCTVSGGAPAASQAIVLLLAAGADLNAVDAAGRRPVDLIPTARILCSLRSSLENVLIGNVSPPLSPSTSSSSSSSADKEKKKNYPIDPSIPDIQSSIYSSDEFRMFAFKIKPCSRAYSHDWTECPFAHPGENARRRDPRRFPYSSTPCSEFRRGNCPKGDHCEYSHGVFECWLHPAQYRTRLCKEAKSCSRRVCFFAHSSNDLRSLPAVNFPFVPPACLSPASQNHHHHHRKQQQQQSILSPTAANSLHRLVMSPRIMEEGVAGSPAISCRPSFSAEREKLLPPFPKQQTRGSSPPTSHPGEEPDISWIETLVDMPEAGNGERFPYFSAIDEEHAIQRAWLEQMQRNIKPAS